MTHNVNFSCELNVFTYYILAYATEVKEPEDNNKHIICCYVGLLFWDVIIGAGMREGWSEVEYHKLNSSIWRSQNKATFPGKCNVNIFLERILYVSKVSSVSETQTCTDTSKPPAFQGLVSFIGVQKLC